MCSLLRVIVVMCVFACAAVVIAGPVTDSIAFQGRLEDSGGNPAPGGLRDLTLSFWTDSVGGSMVHTELRSVDVTSGLYSTCIGCDDSSFFDIFSDQSIFLEVQLAGEPPMAPRIALRYVPRSFVSGRVRGDIYTENGLLRVRDNLGSSGQDGVEVRADDTSSNISMGNIGSSGQDGVEIHMGATERRLRVSGLGSSGEDGVEVRTSPSSSRIKVAGIGSSGHDGVSIVDSAGVGSMALARKRPGRAKYSSVSLRVEPDSIVEWRDVDSDDDGLSDSRMTMVVGHGGGGGAGGLMMIQADVDGDGNPETEYSHSVSPTTSAVAIKTKGTGADKDRISGVAAEADDTTAFVASNIDLNGDGIPDLIVSSRVLPTKAGFAIKTKGTGADPNRSSGVTAEADDTTSGVTCDIDLDGDGISEILSLQLCTIDSVVRENSFTFTDPLLGIVQMKAKEKGNRTKCGNNLRCENPSTTTEADFSCDTAAATATWSSSSTLGTAESLTIQVSASGTTTPIVHSSGAMLTSGGVWTNASDENLKENFEPVAGHDILQKIEELRISQWNYKNETDEARHIGPTAQDFNALFGVGTNDKTISTIDPSGIALVAIKQLKKENDELRQELETLKKMVQSLSNK